MLLHLPRTKELEAVQERVEKFRADITAAAYLQISAVVSDDALARWAAQLAPVVAIEAIIA